MPATLINEFPEPAEARRAPAGAAAASLNPDAEEVVALVLQMLRERMGMDVVFVSSIADLAPAPAPEPLNVPILLRDGRVHGVLCCYSLSSSQAVVERDLRSLRYSARLAARLLDNIQILKDLARRSVHH